MRLEVTRRADLAVQALILLARSDRRMKSSELAQELGTTSGFVPQVLAPLVERSWVQSEPGPTGGYVAAVELDEVTLLAVIEAVDGPTENGLCVVEDRPCSSARPCVLHSAWTRAREHLLAELAGVTLAALPVRDAATGSTRRSR